jgi:Mce-associated membrane protein
MADDAAAPEGKLTGADEDPKDPEEVTESPRPDDTDTADTAEDTESADGAGAEAAEPAKEPMSTVKLATIIGLVVVIALGGAVGWLGYRAMESQERAQQQEVFLQVGRQAALNLTTIDHTSVDEDVQRILESATDAFYDDFAARSQPFVEVVRQAQSTSVGEVTSAGIESDDPEGAQVLVAVTVRTSNAGAPEQQPRAWRMRITVKQVGDETKVSNVEFVP